MKKKADAGAVSLTPSKKKSPWRTDHKPKSKYRSKWEMGKFKHPEGSYKALKKKAEEEYMIDLKQQIRLPEWKKRDINKWLYNMSRRLYNAIPITEIIDECKSYEVLPIQEDGTEWDGFLTGESGKALIQLGYQGKLVSNCQLQVSWYRFETGRYELNAYIA